MHSLQFINKLIKGWEQPTPQLAVSRDSKKLKKFVNLKLFYFFRTFKIFFKNFHLKILQMFTNLFSKRSNISCFF